MKVYKKMLLNFTVLSLVLVGSTASCGKEQVLNNNNDVWVCNPEPNVTITLSFDSSYAYVSTSPQNLRDTIMPNGKKYLFNDGDKYIVRGDTLCFVDSNPNVPTANYGFILKKISSDKIELQSYGVEFIALYAWVTDYSFERKIN